MKTDLINWLERPEIDYFLTVTLRQAVLTDDGCWRSITPDDVKKTAWLLRDRFSKALVGPAAFKRRRCPTFVVFAEGDGRNKRYHLHIAASKPSDVSEYDYADVFRRTAKRLDWVYDEIDIRPVDRRLGGNVRAVIAYSLKEGAEAFLPEASFVPELC